MEHSSPANAISNDYLNGILINPVRNTLVYNRLYFINTADNRFAPFCSHRKSYEKGMFSYENGALSYEKGMFSYENGTPPYENSTLPYENDAQPYENAVQR